MELPHIGDHCSRSDCNQFDFLPIICNLCGNKYCQDHHKYENHSCPESYKIDVKVPICPLCNQAVPSKRGLAPDLAVNEHLENNCKSKKQKTSKKCSVPNCKGKELVPITCNSCSLNFCLRHRHTSDHDCKGPAAARREQTLNGSIFNKFGIGLGSSGNSNASEKSHSKRPSQSCATTTVAAQTQNRQVVHVSPAVRNANVSIFQADLSEEEALQIALQESKGQSQSEAADAELARAIARSEQEARTTERRSTAQSMNCVLS